MADVKKVVKTTVEELQTLPNFKEQKPVVENADPSTKDALTQLSGKSDGQKSVIDATIKQTGQPAPTVTHTKKLGSP